MEIQDFFSSYTVWHERTFIVLNSGDFVKTQNMRSVVMSLIVCDVFKFDLSLSKRDNCSTVTAVCVFVVTADHASAVFPRLMTLNRVCVSISDDAGQGESMLRNHTTAQFLYVIAGFSLVLLAFMYYTLDTTPIYSQFGNTLDTTPIYSQFVNTSSTLVQVSTTTVPVIGDVSSEVIRILYATGLYRLRDWNWGEGSAPLSECPDMIGRCEFTTNMSRVNESDALMFFMRNHLGSLYRQPHQKWIFAIYESPVHTHKSMPYHENKFNLTMTYLHSPENDIDWSYGRCSRITDDDRRLEAEHASEARLNGSAGVGSTPHVNYARGKKHLAAWFVSHCIAMSRREMYVKEMQKYADIHIYGCGPYKCRKTKDNNCDEELLNNDYKFYLSFENSFCKDYVTEKLWRVMSINIVPIVLGHVNYSQMLPPHSYIDVRDFDSPKHLAEHLQRIDANDTLYNEYFAWKTRYRCGAVSKNVACDLCRHLHKTRGHQERVKKLSTFWGIDNNCIDARTFYKTLGVKADAWPTMNQAKDKYKSDAKKEAMNKLKQSEQIKKNKSR